MTDITTDFGKEYVPETAILIYREKDLNPDYYVESYRLDSTGKPLHGRPLSTGEAASLARKLDCAGLLQKAFLKPAGLLPAHVLFLDPSGDGCAMWYSRPLRVHLFFTADLGIECGQAWLPPLLWKANRESLSVFALKAKGLPDLDTSLYKAPFFNLYANGNVCMGNVKINIPLDCCLESFMQQWQDYFFRSEFSHLIGMQSPVSGNIVQLWQQLVGTGRKFPLAKLIKTDLKIKDLLS